MSKQRELITPEIEKQIIDWLCRWNWGDKSLDVTYELWELLWKQRPVEKNKLRFAWDKFSEEKRR